MTQIPVPDLGPQVAPAPEPALTPLLATAYTPSALNGPEPDLRPASTGSATGGRDALEPATAPPHLCCPDLCPPFARTQRGWLNAGGLCRPSDRRSAGPRAVRVDVPAAAGPGPA